MDEYYERMYESLLIICKLYPNLDMASKISPTMFCKPNATGMQSVFYSLIFVLNPDYCRKNIPWPIAFSADAYKFRTSVLEYIKQDCEGFELPQLAASLMNKVTGDKFTRFVFNFVNYVMKTIIERKYDVPILEKPASNVCAKTNLILLDANTLSMVKENDLNQVKYELFMKNTCQLIKNQSECLQNLMKIQKVKENQIGSLALHEKPGLTLQLLSERVSVEELFDEMTKEVEQLAVQCQEYESKKNAFSEKKEELRHLIELKSKLSSSDVMNPRRLNLRLNPDIASICNTSLAEMRSSLFKVDANVSNPNVKICLKTFFEFGAEIVKTHIDRLSSLKLDKHHIPVYRKAESILSTFREQLAQFLDLESRLSIMIEENKRELPHLENNFYRVADDFSQDPRVLEICKQRKDEHYYPALQLAQIPSHPLFAFDKVDRKVNLRQEILDRAKKDEFCENQ